MIFLRCSWKFTHGCTLHGWWRELCQKWIFATRGCYYILIFGFQLLLSICFTITFINGPPDDLITMKPIDQLYTFWEPNCAQMCRKMVLLGAIWPKMKLIPHLQSHSMCGTNKLWLIVIMYTFVHIYAHTHSKQFYVHKSVHNHYKSKFFHVTHAMGSYMWDQFNFWSHGPQNYHFSAHMCTIWFSEGVHLINWFSSDKVIM